MPVVSVAGGGTGVGKDALPVVIAFTMACAGASWAQLAEQLDISLETLRRWRATTWPARSVSAA